MIENVCAKLREIKIFTKKNYDAALVIGTQWRWRKARNGSDIAAARKRRTSCNGSWKPKVELLQRWLEKKLYSAMEDEK